MYNIYVDDKLFAVTRTTINNYPSGLLSKIINGTGTSPYVIVDNNDLYVDRDPKSFAFVIDYLRNYDIMLSKVTDPFLREKIVDDLDYFGLYCNYDYRVKEEQDIVCDEMYTQHVDNSIAEKKDEHYTSSVDSDHSFYTQHIGNHVVEKKDDHYTSSVDSDLSLSE